MENQSAHVSNGAAVLVLALAALFSLPVSAALLWAYRRALAAYELPDGSWPGGDAVLAGFARAATVRWAR
jgi:hypothetical protein